MVKRRLEVGNTALYRGKTGQEWTADFVRQYSEPERAAVSQHSAVPKHKFVSLRVSHTITVDGLPVTDEEWLEYAALNGG